jgi:alkylhydroperoxidase family enzyme
MTTPRIAPVAPSDAALEVQPIFETYLKERGNIPNMFRTVALRPSHLRTLIAHFRTVMNDGTVPPLLKELLWVRISHLNGCRY